MNQFIVFQLYSPTYPAALFGGTAIMGARPEYELSGSAVVLSGGLVIDEDELTAQPAGIMSLRPVGWRFIEKVCSALVASEDRVLIIDQKHSPVPGKWQVEHDDIRVLETNDAFVIFLNGQSVQGLDWLEGVQAGSETYMLAAKDCRSPQYSRLAGLAVRQESILPAMEKYWEEVIAHPRKSLEKLGCYRLFTFISGWCVEDFVIQRSELEVECMRSILCSAAREFSVPLYEGYTVFSESSAEFWSEEDPGIPRNWNKLV